jgi:hypothetical protein
MLHLQNYSYGPNLRRHVLQPDQKVWAVVLIFSHPLFTTDCHIRLYSGEARVQYYWVQLLYLRYDLSLKVKGISNLMKDFEKALGSLAPNRCVSAPPLRL